jgi:hypothetical protein
MPHRQRIGQKHRLQSTSSVLLKGKEKYKQEDTWQESGSLWQGGTEAPVFVQRAIY